MNFQYEEAEVVDIHCTDKDQWFKATIVSKSKHNIVMAIYDGKVRLNFALIKPNVYVASREGYEFVYKQG